MSRLYLICGIFYFPTHAAVDWIGLVALTLSSKSWWFGLVWFCMVMYYVIGDLVS